MYNIIIYDENKNKVDIEVLEKEEQNLANKYILQFDSILELGARYGSVSCISNLKLDNKSNHVVVEPDTKVWDALEYNKINNNCDFNIVKGFLSKNLSSRSSMCRKLWNCLPVREYAPSLVNIQRTPSSLGCIKTFSEKSILFSLTLCASIGFIIIF